MSKTTNRNVKSTNERSSLLIVNISLSICYKLWENFFVFTINIPAKSNITCGLIFRGKRPARPTGAYFQRGLIFEGGLLFRVYSIHVYDTL